MKSISSAVFLSTLMVSTALAAETARLDAEEIKVDDATGIISARGAVEARAEDRVLKTESLTFNREEATLSVPNKVRLREADGSLLSADSAQIDSQLERGVFNSVAFSTKGARMQSQVALRDGMQLNLKGATFTSCPACEDPNAAPLWQIRAGSIDYDRAAQNVSYRHSRLEIFGLPMFYLPYMAHAGPEVERRSGVLTPSLGSNGDFGSYVEIPYFFDLAPNYDLTVTPRISAKQSPFLTAEWRHLTNSGSYQATGYIHRPEDELTQDTARETRGGLLAEGNFYVGAWQYGFDIQQASDGLFFKRYKIFDPARLTSSINLSRSIGGHRLRIEGFVFDETTGTETVSAMLPRISHNYAFRSRPFGGRLSLRNAFTRQQRDSDVDTAHLTSKLDWSWRHITQGGFILSAKNRLALDLYDFTIEDGDDAEETAETAETFLSANSLALTLAYPLQRQTDFDRQTLSPQIQLVIADADEGYDDIPFIADTTRDLTRAQLFNPLAAKDEASRVNLGIGHELHLGPRLATEAFLGQSYNLSDETYSDASSGFDHDGNDRSALLANASLYAGPFNLSHEARFTDDGGELLRSETRLGLGLSAFNAKFDHSYYAAGQQQGSALSQQNNAVLEEATATLGWQVGQLWRLDARLRENLETKQRVDAEAAFTYEDDCTLASITIKRDYSTTGAIEPDTSINFTFTLKTISN